MASLTQADVRRTLELPARAIAHAGESSALERWVGAVLADASDEALDDVVEAIAEDPTYWLLLEKPSEAWGASPTPGHLENLWAHIGATFGAEPDFLTGVRLHVAVIQAQAALQVQSPTTPILGREPLWFVYDPAIPPALGRAVLHGVYASIAFYGIAFAAKEAGPTSPRWRRAIIARWAASLREYARFVAALSPAAVPSELVHEEERLPLDALFQQNETSREALASLVKVAEQSGRSAGAEGEFSAPRSRVLRAEKWQRGVG